MEPWVRSVPAIESLCDDFWPHELGDPNVLRLLQAVRDRRPTRSRRCQLDPQHLLWHRPVLPLQRGPLRRLADGTPPVEPDPPRRRSRHGGRAGHRFASRHVERSLQPLRRPTHLVAALRETGPAPVAPWRGTGSWLAPRRLTQRCRPASGADRHRAARWSRGGEPSATPPRSSTDGRHARPRRSGRGQGWPKLEAMSCSVAS